MIRETACIVIAVAIFAYESLETPRKQDIKIENDKSATIHTTVTDFSVKQISKTGYEGENRTQTDVSIKGNVEKYASVKIEKPKKSFLKVKSMVNKTNAVAMNGYDRKYSVHKYLVYK